MKTQINIGIGGILLAIATAAVGVYFLNQQSFERKLSIGSIIALTSILIVLVGLLSLKISRNSSNITAKNSRPTTTRRVDNKVLNFFTGVFIVFALAPVATFGYYFYNVFKGAFKGITTFKECWNNLDKFNQNTIISFGIITGILLLLTTLLAIGAKLGQVKDSDDTKKSLSKENELEGSEAHPAADTPKSPNKT